MPTSNIPVHRLTAGGPKNFNQDDVDYCCNPLVSLKDLAEEAVQLNPSLILRTKADYPELEAQLTALRKTEKTLVENIAALQTKLGAAQGDLTIIQYKIRHLEA